MKQRLQYNGGQPQQDRMKEDKLKSLKKSLLYSYQAATAILSDGREFRCLINPDKLKNNYDDKIISIPFEDMCIGKVNTKGIEHIDNKFYEDIPLSLEKNGVELINLQPGDVFTWKENKTDWIVFLQRLEETAYFRAEIRKCNYEIKVNDNIYKAWVRGPSKETITWHNRNTKPKIDWNDIDYDLEMYITKNEETLEFFHRFTKIKINNKNWEVHAVDNMSVDGIIEVALKEDFTNSIEEEVKKIEEQKVLLHSRIVGETTIYPFDKRTYKIVKTEETKNIIGEWTVDNEKIIILNQDDLFVELFVDTSKTGGFNLTYKNSEEEIILPIVIDSL